VRLAVLLLVLLPVVVAHGEEDPDAEPGGLSTRLRAIDESAEFEADHPERAGEEPAEAEEEQPVDPTVLPAEEIEAAAPPRSRRSTQPARPSGAASAPVAPTAPPAPPARPLGSTLESPIGTGPLAPSRDADDEF
jgi:hypothetical protein